MISLIFTLLCNLIRWIFAKLKYRERYQSGVVQRISNVCSITLFNKGEIHLGKNIELAPSVDVQVHGNGMLTIGERTYMNRFCMISCHGKISIGSNCMFGPGVKLFDNNHKFTKKQGVSTNLNIGEISIGNNCWIASDVILLKGASIGDNCVIGAGCIIDKKIPTNSLVRLQQNLSIQELR